MNLIKGSENKIDAQFITGNGIEKGDLSKKEALWANTIDGEMICGNSKNSKKKAKSFENGFSETEDKLFS